MAFIVMPPFYQFCRPGTGEGNGIVAAAECLPDNGQKLCKL